MGVEIADDTGTKLVGHVGYDSLCVAEKSTFRSMNFRYVKRVYDNRNIHLITYEDDPRDPPLREYSLNGYLDTYVTHIDVEKYMEALRVAIDIYDGLIERPASATTFDRNTPCEKCDEIPEVKELSFEFKTISSTLKPFNTVKFISERDDTFPIEVARQHNLNHLSKSHKPMSYLRFETFVKNAFLLNDVKSISVAGTTVFCCLPSILEAYKVGTFETKKGIIQLVLIALYPNPYTASYKLSMVAHDSCTVKGYFNGVVVAAQLYSRAPYSAPQLKMGSVVGLIDRHLDQMEESILDRASAYMDSVVYDSDHSYFRHCNVFDYGGMMVRCNFGERMAI